MLRQRRSRILATLGPASSSMDRIRALALAGADVFRLNFSHGSHADHAARYDAIRAVEREIKRPIGVLMDLQGPKLRVGALAGGKALLESGARFRLDLDSLDGDSTRARLPHPEIFAALHPGAELLLDDGKLRLRVDACGPDHAETTVQVGGWLSDRKGVNVPGVVLPISPLTAKDRADLAFGLELGVDWVALSFVQRPEDIREARALVGKRAWIMAKLEKPAAIDALDEIVALSDGIMVARGDLAVEVGNAAVPALQKKMIRMARDADKLVITATQMMESMITNPVPTRAEVSDVANAVLDGTDAVMLSAETAAGKYPLETVRQMAAVCEAAEEHDPVELDADFSGATFTRIDQSIAMGALFTAYHLGAKAIVALTDSGSTALWMSRHRVRIPIYALTPRVSSQRKMALYRNVRPMLMDTAADRDTALKQAEAYLKRQDVVAAGDVYAITCGEPMGAPGGTNMLQICRVS